MVNILRGWLKSFLGGYFSFGDVAPPQGWAGLSKNGWSTPRDGGHDKERIVTNFKNLFEDFKSNFDSTKNNLGIKLTYFSQST